jgi:nucleotide-binding universal stress UspA family protein
VTEEVLMYRTIVLAYDGSEAGQQALLRSKEITQWQNAQLHLLAVVPFELVALGPESAYYSEDQQRFEEQKYRDVLQAGLAQLSINGVQAQGELCKGDPVDQIIRYAERIDADLIVLGHKHRNHWLERWWRGSVSKALIEHAPCSVLVVIIH